MKPIELKLYNPETWEVERTEVVPFIPWKFTKKLLQAQKEVNAEGDSEKSLNQIVEIVMDVFQGRITTEDIESKADFGDIVALFKTLGERFTGN